jgi:hypothetical protein
MIGGGCVGAVEEFGEGEIRMTIKRKRLEPPLSPPAP